MCEDPIIALQSSIEQLEATRDHLIRNCLGSHKPRGAQDGLPVTGHQLYSTGRDKGALSMERIGKLRKKHIPKEIARILEHEYLKDSPWTTKKITEIARRLRMNRTKIYKW